MPQLDIATFFNQIFSTLVVFFIYFLIVSKGIIPSVTQIFQTREKYFQIMRSMGSDSAEVSEKDLKVKSEFDSCHLANK
jgi:F0F1-type ATP synthase membrane subunit b/b'